MAGGLLTRADAPTAPRAGASADTTDASSAFSLSVVVASACQSQPLSLCGFTLRRGGKALRVLLARHPPETFLRVPAHQSGCVTLLLAHSLAHTLNLSARRLLWKPCSAGTETPQPLPWLPPALNRAKAQHACVLRPPERGGVGCQINTMVMVNCTKKTAHAVPLASARQHPENQRKTRKPGRPFAGAHGGGSVSINTPMPVISITIYAVCLRV